jgi:hypothetical protein
MNSQFNAIDYSQQLQAAGVSQPQAEVHARAVSQALTDCTASKADLAALDDKLSARMDAFEERITIKMDAFQVRLEAFEIRIVARLDSFESTVKLALAAMRVEIEQIRGEQKLLRWMCATNAAMLIAVLVKIYFP